MLPVEYSLAIPPRGPAFCSYAPTLIEQEGELAGQQGILLRSRGAGAVPTLLLNTQQDPRS